MTTAEMFAADIDRYRDEAVADATRAAEAAPLPGRRRGGRGAAGGGGVESRPPAGGDGAREGAAVNATPICVGGLIDTRGLDGETEPSACHGCPGCPEITDRHTLSCAVWTSNSDPCDCGTGEVAPVVAAWRGAGEET